jgi:hypothetical protein
MCVVLFRHKIYYCTLLQRAETPEQKESIVEEMLKTEAGEKVWD